MGRMKDLLITVHNGGDEAVAAVERMGKDWREHLEQAAAEIERLRLTDAEREAIEGMISDSQEIAEFNEERCHPHYAEKARRRAAMLIGLLERLG